MSEDNVTLLRERIQEMINKVRDKYATWPPDNFTREQLAKTFHEFFAEVENDKAVHPQKITKNFSIIGEHVLVETSFFPRFDLSTKLIVSVRFELGTPTISGLPPKRFYRKLRIPE